MTTSPKLLNKMAVLVASGSYLPTGLTFGPTNGPEDFLELVFVVFSRRLCQEWLLFLDDLSVATGKPPPHPYGPSVVHDASKFLTQTEWMLAAKGLGRSAKSDPSPYAHWYGLDEDFGVVLPCILTVWLLRRRIACGII